MKLSDIVKSTEVSRPIDLTDTQKDGEVEKIAELLEALSEEDTLVDDLARAAVAMEFLERQYGQKGNA